eukprot:5366103-Ditylum_brightwellii.AAC.1
MAKKLKLEVTGKRKKTSVSPWRSASITTMCLATAKIQVAINKATIPPAILRVVSIWRVQQI